MTDLTPDQLNILQIAEVHKLTIEDDGKDTFTLELPKTPTLISKLSTAMAEGNKIIVFFCEQH